MLRTSLTREILGSSYVETRFVPPKVNFLATTEFVANKWTSGLRKITFLFLSAVEEKTNIHSVHKRGPHSPTTTQ